MTNRAQDWSPNSLEKKCLKHLDSAENWTRYLKHERPPSSEPQPWRPFWRIYLINIANFLAVFALMFGTLEIGFTGVAGLREDLPFLVGLVVVFAMLFAGYVTHLYRRSWNRRAARINSELVDGYA